MLLRLTINGRRKSFAYYADEIEAAKAQLFRDFRSCFFVSDGFAILFHLISFSVIFHQFLQLFPQPFRPFFRIRHIIYDHRRSSLN